MRTLTDINGFSIRPEDVQGVDSHARLHDGRPYLARRFRLFFGRRQMQRRGVFVHGLDELEREIAMTPHDSSTLPPNERWTAHLVGPTDWQRRVRQYLDFIWYQEGADPMKRLAELVSTLDFKRHCHEEAVDDS
jgi:hypothetical protein